MPENDVPEQLVRLSREINRKHAGIVVSMLDHEAFIRVNLSDGQEIWRLLVNRENVRAHLKNLSTGDSVSFQVSGNYLTHISKINQNELESLQDSNQVEAWEQEPLKNALNVLVSSNVITRLQQYSKFHGLTLDETVNLLLSGGLYDAGY